jgi:hypothetical protein
VTFTEPAAISGTATVIEVADYAVTVAAVAPKVTVLVPCEAPKLLPVKVTVLPATPEIELREVRTGTTTTMNGSLLEAFPPTVTVTFAEPVARAGTVAVIEVADHAVTVAAVAPKVTVLVPCEAPKSLPVKVTELPTTPTVGLREERTGTETTVNGSLLEALPSTVTVTLTEPAARVGTVTVIEVADHAVTVAAVAPKFTVLAPPGAAPKLRPVKVTELPAAPDVGVIAERLGVLMTPLSPLHPVNWIVITTAKSKRNLEMILRMTCQYSLLFLV